MRTFIKLALICGIMVGSTGLPMATAQQNTKLVSAASAAAQSSSSPFSNLLAAHSPTVLGVSTHNVHESLWTMQLMFDSGIRVIRIDLFWPLVETSQGRFDFATPGYEQFVARAATAGLTVMFILDYANPLYDNGYSPFDDAGRTAFAQFALASVAHFQRKGVIWEIYNEPLGFWTPANTYTPIQITSLYLQLATQVTSAIKTQYPDEIVVGPAQNDVDTDGTSGEVSNAASLITTFLSKAGQQVDGISVHPYRPIPESSISDLAWLHALASSSPKALPVVSTEWGYSSTWYSGQGSQSPENRKAAMVVRSVLANIMTNTNLSVIYDWMDDGTDATNGEHNFGLVYPYDTGSDNPIIAKTAAYEAVKTFWSELSGYTLIGRIQTGNAADFLLRFGNSSGSDQRYVCWTQSETPHPITVPVEAGASLIVTDMLGNTPTTATAGSRGYSCNASSSPVYVSHTINKATPSITASSSVATVGQTRSIIIASTVIATSAAVTPTGTISFTLDGKFVGNVDLSKTGTAQIVITPTPAGTAQLTASYSGDAQYTAISRAFSLIDGTIDQPRTAVVSVQPSANQIYSGQPVDVNVAVSGNDLVPTGSIVVSGGGYSSPQIALAGGKANLTIPANSLSPGTVTLKIAYSGDLKFATATQSSSLIVTQSTFTLTATPSTPPTGASAAWQVKVDSTTGYSGTVSINCSVTGTGAQASPTAQTCVVPAQPLTVGDAATITIGATVVGQIHPPAQTLKLRRTIRMSGAGVLLLSFGALWVLPKRCKCLFTILLVLASLPVLTMISACSAVHTASSTSTSGATTATYQVNIQGLGNPAVTPSPSISLTVGK